MYKYVDTCVDFRNHVAIYVWCSIVFVVKQTSSLQSNGQSNVYMFQSMHDGSFLDIYVQPRWCLTASTTASEQACETCSKRRNQLNLVSTALDPHNPIQNMCAVSDLLDRR